MRKRDIPEPWMFGCTVEIDGRTVHGEIGRFTLLGRVRMATRRLLGRQAIPSLLPPDEDPQ